MTYQWYDYTSADAPIAESFLDPAARRFTGCEEGWEDYCTYWLGEPETRLGENFWVKLIRLEGEPVAVMALFLGDGVLLVSEFILSPAMRGRGHGSAILRELLACGEEILGFEIHRARAVIFPENRASIRAFEKAGIGFESAHPDGDALYYVYERPMDRGRSLS